MDLLKIFVLFFVFISVLFGLIIAKLGLAMKISIISEVLAYIKDSHIIAGAAGGALRWNTLKEDFKSGIISVVTGAIMAVYLTDAMSGIISGILKLIGIIAVIPSSSAAFIVGVCGTTIITFVLDFIAMYRKRNLDKKDA